MALDQLKPSTRQARRARAESLLNGLSALLLGAFALLGALLILAVL